jgi:hypothetical protein
MMLRERSIQVDFDAGIFAARCGLRRPPFKMMLPVRVYLAVGALNEKLSILLGNDMASCSL